MQSLCALSIFVTHGYFFFLLHASKTQTFNTRRITQHASLSNALLWGEAKRLEQKEEAMGDMGRKQGSGLSDLFVLGGRE
jgi:hypothetical protein